MTQVQSSTWKDLALKGEWNALLSLLQGLETVEAKLWEIKALRALSQGDKANETLLELASSDLKCRPEAAVELGEELIQCAMFQHAGPVIASVIAQHPLPGYFLKASSLRERAKYPDALSELTKINNNEPAWSRLVMLGEAWVRIRQGRLARAEECLQPWKDDQTIATQKLLARFELASGQLKNAVFRLEQISKRQPYDWEWQHLLASGYLSLGKNVKMCAELIEQGLKRQPRQAEAYALLVKIHLLEGNQTSAREALANALAIKPWLDAPIMPFIETYASRREFTEAEELLKKVSSLSMTPRRKAILLDLMRLQNQRKKKISKYAKQLELDNPDDPSVLRSVAAAYIAIGQSDPASSLLERIISLNPYDLAAKNNLAALLKNRGNLDDAISVLGDISEQDPTAKFNLARALTERGDFVHSARVWDDLSTNQSSNTPSIQRGLAELSIKQGQMIRALEHINRACIDEPEYDKNWLVKARITKHLTGSFEACKILEEAQTIVHDKIALRTELVKLWTTLLTPSESLKKIREWIEKTPDEVEYHLLEASVATKCADYQRAELALRNAKSADELIGEIELIRFLLQRGRFSEAQKAVNEWLHKDKKDIRRWAQLTEVYFLANDPHKALDAVNSALALEPLRSSLVRQKIGILLNLERYKEAESCALELWLHNKEYNSLSMLLRTIERQLDYSRSVAILQNALKEKPRDLWLKRRLARQYDLIGHPQRGLSLLKEIHSEFPDNELINKELIRSYVRNDDKKSAQEVMLEFSRRFPSRYDLQVALAEIALNQGLVVDARNLLKNVCAESPDTFDAWILSAMVERRAEDSSSEKLIWITIKEKFPIFRWVNIAWQHWLRLGMEKEIEVELNRWRTEEPNNPAPWWIASSVALKLSRYDIANRLFEGIERRTGRTPELLAARATLANELYRTTEAQNLIAESCNLAPTSADFLEKKIGINLKSGNWSHFETDFNRLSYLLSSAKYDAYERFFFNLNCHPTLSASELFDFYRNWGEHVLRKRPTVARSFERSYAKGKKIRIGYISPDFRQHAVAKFSKPILRHHDRNSFELFAYAHLENGKHDDWTTEFKSYVDHWREIQYWSVDEIEGKVLEDKIDILVDLAGHTSNNSLSTFQRRLAPIQASHVIGSGQTTGMTSVDYLIASKELWPEDCDQYASEQIARVDHEGMVFDIPTDAPAVETLPALITGTVTFGVFSRPLRVNARCIRVWAEILKRCPGAKLRFEHAPYLESDIQQRFSEMFESHGVEAERIEFSYTRPYWVAFNGIDIQLDPFPAGSGTTATEGLYMGRPVVALCDRPAMGRMAHAQLVALDLHSLCSASTELQYLEKAVNLATNLQLLKTLSSSLRERFLDSPIVNYDGYATALSAVYKSQWNRWLLENSPSKNIQVYEPAHSV